MLMFVHQPISLKVAYHGLPDHPLQGLDDVGCERDWSEVGRLRPAVTFVHRGDVGHLEDVGDLTRVQGAPQDVAQH